jgi:hypothetical protein
MRWLLLLTMACQATPTDPITCDDVACDGTLVCDADTVTCVEPARLGSPTFEVCAGAPDGGLAAKAEAYQRRADQLHVHPDLGVMLGVELAPDTDPMTATWQDVSRWASGENDGLWSSLYLAAEAFRVGATSGAERDAALARLRLLLHAEKDRTDVSGVPGNLVRQYVPPGIEGLSCPSSDDAYRADVEKDDNRWVRIGDDGCITYLPTEGDTWTVSDTCPGTDFAGWCFLDNTSKDEYAGHLFALSAVLKLVDDPESVAIADEILLDVATHFLDNEMWIVDHDGRRTEHGDMTPAKEGGLAAAMALATMSMATQRFGDARFDDAYRCFAGLPVASCPEVDPKPDGTFASWLSRSGVHLDANGCLTNDNVASMFIASMSVLIWWEADPELRASYQAVLTDVWDHDSLRALSKRQNAWYDVMWAAFKDLGEGSDGPAYGTVTDATCGLAAFPDDKTWREVPLVADEVLCLDRLDRPMADRPLGPDERCIRTFMWWNDQYVLRECSVDPLRVDPPADYLLPYWMGRYFGFVAQEW